MGTGDASGTWGNTTNTNLELIGEALGFGTEAITTNADTHATTVADGASDAGRAMYLKYTGTLDSTCTITIGPNTMKRVQIIENGTSGSQSIIIKQGSGATITILTGEVKVVSLDGAGSGAAVTEVFTDLSLASPRMTGTPTSTTANAGTDTTQVATTAFVKTAVDNAEPFPSSTSMLFQQTSAPTGWTKQTTHNDKALRIITGTVGTGGSVAFSTALGSGATVAGGSVSGNPTSNLSVSVSGNISNTTLSINQIPSHSHGSGRNLESPFNQVSDDGGGTGGFTTNTGNAGGGGAHNHGHNLSGSVSGNITAGNLAVGASTAAINVNYVDFIIANKD